MKMEMQSHIAIGVTKRSDLSDRKGIDADEKRLEDVFIWLGFDVYYNRNINFTISINV